MQLGTRSNRKYRDRLQAAFSSRPHIAKTWQSSCEELIEHPYPIFGCAKAEQRMSEQPYFETPKNKLPSNYAQRARAISANGHC